MTRLVMLLTSLVGRVIDPTGRLTSHVGRVIDPTARLCPAVPLTLLLAALINTGCQTAQQQARQQAIERWNLARAEVKARLAEDQFAAGNVRAAAQELAEARRLAPQHPEFIPLQARVLLADGQIGAAADLLAQANLQGRAQAEIEYLLGIVRQQQMRWEEALAAFRRAVEIDPDEVAYVVAATQAWLQLGRPQEALDQITALADRHAWTDAYQVALAECHEQLGNWSAAATTWQGLAAGCVEDVLYQERLATALFRAGRLAEAIPVLQQTLSRGQAPTTQLLRLMLAECYLAEGRASQAREQAQLAARSAPDDARVQRVLARALAACGDYQAALRVVRRALSADPQDLLSRELAAALAWRLGDNEAAVADALRLRTQDARNPVAERVLGER